MMRIKFTFCIFLINIIISSFIISAEASIPYKVVESEKMMKGGQLEPLIRPQYSLYRINAVLKDSESLSEENIRAVFDEIIADTRQEKKPDAISIYLHLSDEHYSGDSIAFARADWWPKGHSLAPSNKANIANKDTYVVEYHINLPKESNEDDTVNRLSESKRKEIYTALVKSEDKAHKEAEAKYPMDSSKIPFSQLKNYDFAGMGKKNVELSNKLMKKYRKELLKKYKISDEELKKISNEAFNEDWPLPKY